MTRDMNLRQRRHIVTDIESLMTGPHKKYVLAYLRERLTNKTHREAVAATLAQFPDDRKVCDYVLLQRACDVAEETVRYWYRHRGKPCAKWPIQRVICEVYWRCVSHEGHPHGQFAWSGAALAAQMKKELDATGRFTRTRESGASHKWLRDYKLP